jgi:uncharacterized tellurite resistance protein B-like protein
MDIVTKKKLNILIQLAEADKHFDNVEKDIILRVAREQNFSDENVYTLIRNPEPIGTLGALSENQKFDYIIACIELVFADEKVHESELTFCRGIAIKLGFKKNVVDYLIENLEKMSRDEIRKKIFQEFV